MPSPLGMAVKLGRVRSGTLPLFFFGSAAWASSGSADRASTSQRVPLRGEDIVGLLRVGFSCGRFRDAVFNPSIQYNLLADSQTPLRRLATILLLVVGAA